MIVTRKDPIREHIDLARDFIDAMPEMPPSHWSGRGIVTAAGDGRLHQLYVMVRSLRPCLLDGRQPCRRRDFPLCIVPFRFNSLFLECTDFADYSHELTAATRDATTPICLFRRLCPKRTALVIYFSPPRRTGA